MNRVRKWFLGLIFGPGPYVVGDSICRKCLHYKCKRYLHKKDAHMCVANARKDVKDPVTGEIGWIGAVDCYDKNYTGECRDFFPKEGIKEESHEIPEQHDGGTDVDPSSKSEYRYPEFAHPIVESEDESTI